MDGCSHRKKQSAEDTRDNSRKTKSEFQLEYQYSGIVGRQRCSIGNIIMHVLAGYPLPSCPGSFPSHSYFQAASACIHKFHVGLHCIALLHRLNWKYNVRREASHQTPIPKCGGDGDRFGDYLCGYCAKLPCVSGRSQFTPEDGSLTHLSHYLSLCSSKVQLRGA